MAYESLSGRRKMIQSFYNRYHGEGGHMKQKYSVLLSALYIILGVIIFVFPMGVLLGFNIFGSGLPESHLFFRIMTVIFVILCLVTPCLIMKFGDIAIEAGCGSLCFALGGLLYLWYGAGWSRFFSILSRPGHPTWGPFRFYTIFGLVYFFGILFYAITYFGDMETSDLIDINETAEDLALKEISRIRPEQKLLLMSLALKEDDYTIYKSLLDKIDDEEILSGLFRQRHDDCWSRAHVIQKIQDPELLASAAKDDPSKDVRKEALKRITDQQVLKWAAEHDKEWNNRSLAAASITDAEILEQLVKNSQNSEVRFTVMEKITDQKVISWAAEHDKDDEVRCIAVEKSEDTDTLHRIAKKDSNSKVRKTALEKITDSEILKWVAEHDDDDKNRCYALERTQDPTVANKLLAHDESVSVRYAACSYADDAEVLNSAVLSDSSVKVQLAALPHVTNQEVLKQIISSENQVSKIAIEKITDTRFLAKVAVESSSSELREYAVKLVSPEELDQAILESSAKEIFVPLKHTMSDDVIAVILRKGADDWDRTCAVKAAENPELIRETAFHDASAEVRRAAIERISDPETLKRLSVVEASIENRILLAEKLDDKRSLVQALESKFRNGYCDYETAVRLRNLYLELNIPKRIREESSHTDEGEEYSDYCCYTDHSDYDETIYSIESL